MAAVRALYLLPEEAWSEWTCGECGSAYPRDIITACPTCSKAARAALTPPPTPEPTPLCSSCGGSGSVPTGAYDETEERDERVACPACDGDGGDAPEPTPGPRSCNRHDDCDAADRDAKANGKPLGAGHCHDDTCEDCFGS